MSSGIRLTLYRHAHKCQRKTGNNVAVDLYRQFTVSIGDNTPHAVSIESNLFEESVDVASLDTRIQPTAHLYISIGYPLDFTQNSWQNRWYVLY